MTCATSGAIVALTSGRRTSSGKMFLGRNCGIPVGSTESAALQVKELQPADSTRWDEFVSSCAEATFFHRAGWKTVIERAFGHRATFLYAEADGKITGVLP